MINTNQVEITSEKVLGSDIINSLNMLITTPMGTVALDRDYGIDTSFLDMPINLAKQMFCAEIITKSRKYEPRITIKKIEFEQNQDGAITPKLLITKA